MAPHCTHRAQLAALLPVLVARPFCPRRVAVRSALRARAHSRSASRCAAERGSRIASGGTAALLSRSLTRALPAPPSSPLRHVFFAGNCAEFKSSEIKSVDGVDSVGEDGVAVRVVEVPRFCDTASAVLLNLHTLEATTISFGTVL